MLIERPPEWFRRLAPEAIFRIKGNAGQRDADGEAKGNGHAGQGDEDGTQGEKRVYLTFDDGPIPEVTPRLLDELDRLGVKGTFFMVGDNVRKYPHLYKEVLRRGHHVGNHTMHHVQGLKMGKTRYMADIEEAAGYIESDLFRPPHGWLRLSQRHALRGRYRLVMYDVVTRDYSKRLTAADVFRNVKRYARDGSIIVFHDSLKSEPRLFEALPKAIEWLREQGYVFGLL